LYACKIEETANGRWRSARRKTRETLEVISQRSVEANGEIDERKTIARIRENQAQRKPTKKRH